MARPLWSLLGLAACFGGAAACSLALDFFQCRNNEDCTNEDGIVLICRDNECISPPDPSSVECTAADECIKSVGDGHICKSTGTCAKLTSEECDEVYAPQGVSDDQILYIGAIMATSAPFDGIGVPLKNAVRLAAEDFNSVAKIDGRQIGVIFCNSRGKANTAKLAADHLVQAGVSAIVGPMFSEEVFAVAESTVPADVFVMSPTATNKDITTLQDDGLVWRNISSDVHQAFALFELTELLEPAMGKLVLFIKDDAYGNGMLDDITAPLQQRLPAGGLVTLKYSDPASFASNEELLSEYGSRIATAITAEPDTIMVVGTSEARELILFYLDNWSSREPLPTLPRFIVSHGGVPVMEDIVNAVAESFRPTLMANVEGVAPIIQDPSNFEAYNIRYKIRFNDEEALTISSLSYDATMVAMLALSTVGAGGTGSEIAEAIARLVDASGTRISFGGAGVKFISDATGLLRDGGNVDLQGVSGALEFNLETGEVRTDLINWDLLPRSTNPNEPVLTPVQQYYLDPPPANGGTWDMLGL